jgi:mannan endo-1,4-beta-mannosidase
MIWNTFCTAGRDLLSPTGFKVILRGINLPLLDDWAFPGSDKLADLEKQLPNCVRIQWYVNYPTPARPAYTLADLDGFLTRCAALRVLPILGLWDLTCEADADRLNTDLIAWWTDPAVVAVLNAHRDYLIINPANELGAFHWAGDPTAALTAYRDAYATALVSLRAAGLEMPVMIDAPDCGISLDAFTTVLDPVPGTCVGQQLIDADPLHNVVLSAHAYWAGTDYMDAIDDAVALNLPFVMGEVANKQADGGDECHFGIDGTHLNADPPTGFKYQDLLTKLLAIDIGWLAWSWNPDGCPARNMAKYDATGIFTGLTPYGEDIANNIAYGLKATAVRF